MATSLSPSQQSSAMQVANLANEIATLKILESTKKGRLKYENGWDKSPHSFYKLVSEVQQQTDIPKARILERVYQITVREKQKNAVAARLEFEDIDHQSSSSCSSSALTLNEYYNSEYYESSSSSRSQSQNHSPIHQITIEKGRNQQQRRVRFSDFPEDDDDDDEIDTTSTSTIRRHSLSHITSSKKGLKNSSINGTNTIIATKKSSLKPPTPKQQQRQQIIKTSPIQSFAVNLNINNNRRSVKSSNLNTTLSPIPTTKTTTSHSSHSPSPSSYDNIIIRRPMKKNFGRFTSGNFRVLDDEDDDDGEEGEYEEEDYYEDEDEEQQRIEEEEIEAQLLRRVGHTMPTISTNKGGINERQIIISNSNKQQMIVNNNSNDNKDKDNDNDTTKNNNNDRLGHILKRGYGIREDEYDDEADARLFFKDCEIYLKADQLLAECDKEYRAIAEERFQQRRRKYSIQKLKEEEIQKEHQLAEIKRLEVSRLEKEEKLLKIREEEKKELADFLAKRRIDKEKDDAIKAELENERQKLLQQYKKQEEEAVAAALAQVQKLEAEKAAIATAKLKAEQEAANELEKEKKLLQDKAIEDAKLKTQQQEQQTSTSGIVTSIGKKQGGYVVPSEFQGYILSLDLQKYLKSQQLLSDHKDRFAYLSSKENKEYYFAALKAVNTPLNSLAKNLVQPKLDQLVQLLQGKSVYLGESTGTSFSAKVQPEGEVFISNLLAFRFVKKSESEISKGRDSVEPLARLGVALAQHFPQWAVLVRANLFQMCPFLVPFSFPQNNMSTQEYALAMGHKLEGSESAVLQALLDKMTGYCTLYGLMVKFWEQHKGSTPQQQQNPSGGDTEEDISEFFSLREVWRILVATIKLKPQVDMTATIVRILLETLGDRLWATYRTQFQKLMQVLITSFLPIIRNETPAGRQAAITRLEIFIENKLKTGF